MRIRVLVTVLLFGLVGCGNGAPATDDVRTSPQLAARLAADGIAVEVGSDAAPVTVQVFEDFRCPYCARFEKVNGPMLAERAGRGELRIRYVFASFLDGRLGGGGSARAAVAARAAVQAGIYPRFHEALFAHQPDERVDGFTPEVLTDIAAGLSRDGARDIAAAVRGGAHRDWVADSQRAYELMHKEHPNGVPTVLINGVDANDALYDRTAFTMLLDSVAASPGTGGR